MPLPLVMRLMVMTTFALSSSLKRKAFLLPAFAFLFRILNLLRTGGVLSAVISTVPSWW